MARQDDEQLRTGPALDATFFDAENKYCPRLDHGTAFRVVETARDTGNDALSSCMDETQGVYRCLNITSEWRYIWVTRHRASLRLLDNRGAVGGGAGKASLSIRYCIVLLRNFNLACLRNDAIA